MSNTIRRSLQLVAAAVYSSLLFLLVACEPASEQIDTAPTAVTSCSEQWLQEIENTLQSGDGHGHGPDIGSEEWKSVIEFRLGIRGKPEIPARDSERWCQYIDDLIRQTSVSSADDEIAALESATVQPSFSCDDITDGSSEALICADQTLAELDNRLAAVYQQALSKATNQHPPILQAEQRGWIKGRDDCWKSNDQKLCIADEYRLRIAELQARYQLIDGKGPVFYHCNGNPANEVVVTYYQTEPATAIAEYGDSVSLMIRETTESGEIYRGRNETLEESDQQLLVRWGYQAEVMRCEITKN